MKTVLQKVTRAAVRVDNEIVGQITHGAVLLVGIEDGDSTAEVDATAKKITGLRFFSGATPMDKTLLDVGGSCLVVSQFTLAANLKKGNRPSFSRAASPELANELYLRLVEQLRAAGINCATGQFQAMMEVELTNNGPITFLIFAENGRVLEPLRADGD